MDEQAPSHSLVGAAPPALLAANARELETELAWFEQVLQQRLQSYFEQQETAHPMPGLSPPALSATSGYGALIAAHELSAQERLIALLALIPLLRPQLLDVLLSRNQDTGRGFTEFGGQLGNQHGGLLPTVETALFLLAGDDLHQRLRAMQWLQPDARLRQRGLVQLLEPGASEPWTSSVLQLNREVVSRLTAGRPWQPDFGVEFPAQRIRTGLDWDYLVLPPSTLAQLAEIRAWIAHGERLLGDWGMRDKLSSGWTSLFHGPPGTGKTLSACLLGKYCGCEVYRVDLSMVVSKYIGETEKNLARVFDAAERHSWILFFDEADALFGKRTKVDDSRDRYANQEISFLLQRVEDFDGVVILASNFKSNIDDAFLRRFQSVVSFALPRPAERLRLWRNALPDMVALEPALELEALANKYDVSGGTIMNVIRYGLLRALMRGDECILREDIDEGMRREYLKEGRRL